MTLDDVRQTLAIARTGATVDDRTWHTTCAWLHERAIAEQACGHPVGVRDRSVETGVEFCRLCRLDEMLRDALTSESQWRARAEKAEKAEEACAAIGEWVHKYGAALKPPFADTFGEGMREAKEQVRALLIAEDAGKDYVHRDALMRVAKRAFDAGVDFDDWVGECDLAAIVQEVAP